MTLRFVDSFDDRTTQYVDVKYRDATGTHYPFTANSVHVAGGRNGTNGADCASSFPMWFIEEKTWIIGFALYYHVDTADAVFMQFTDILSNEEITIHTLAGGILEVCGGAGAPVFGISTAPLLFDTWQYIEVKVFCDGANGTVEIHLDEVPICLVTGVDTDPTGAAAISNILFPALTTDDVIDDIYICDDHGVDNNDFLGDCHVECILPNDDGTPPTAEWFNGDIVGTPAIYQNDGEYPASRLHYNYWDEAMPVPSTDVWSYPDIAVEANDILGVQVSCFAEIHVDIPPPPADSSEMRNICRSGGIDYESLPYTVIPLGWNEFQYYSSIWETNPDGSVYWSVVDFNAAEFGYKLDAYYPP
jgi:hypothetical protein